MTTHQWQFTALGILAGFGTGCVVGVLAGRWVWYSRQDDVSTALRELREELSNLSRVVRLELRQRRSSRTPNQSGEGTSEYVSAQEDENDSESGEESFFNPFPVNNSTSSRDKYVSLDELGKLSDVSKDVCATLHEKLQDEVAKNPEDVDLLWRIARCLVHLSFHCKENPTQEKVFLQQGADYAKKALSLDEQVWQAHHWYAVALGSQAKFEGIQQKITIGQQYKESIDAAIRLSPAQAVLHYLRGRWCYEAAGLTWLERKAASTLFGEPPQSTFEEALECFSKVEQLSNTPWKANQLMIAKCQLKLGDVAKAIEYLQQAELIPTISTEDQDCQKEIQELLQQHLH